MHPSRSASQAEDSYSLLFVTPYYWPAIAACTMLYGSLCSHLVKQGVNLTVCTNEARTDQAEPSFPAAGYQAPHIRTVRNPFLRKKGMVNKALEYLWFTIFVFWVLACERGIDAVFMGSNPPLIAIPIGFLARLKGVRMIYNLQDLFPESAFSAGVVRPESLAGRMFIRLERLNYRLCDMVIGICEPFRTHVLGMAPDCRMEVIPNWIDTEYMEETTRHGNPVLEKFGLSGKFVILYSGNMGYAHDMDVILGAAEMLAGDPDIHFLLIGDGNRKDAAMETVRSLGLSNCTFAPFQPFSDLPHVYSACDVGLVTMRAGSEGSAVPSKAWNYLACRRAIVACVNQPSELAAAVRKSGCGLVVPAGDSQQLSQAIQSLKRDPSARKAMASAGRSYVEAELSERTILARYSAALKACVEA